VCFCSLVKVGQCVCEHGAVPLTVMTIIMSAETSSAPEECLAPLISLTGSAISCISSVVLKHWKCVKWNEKTLLKMVLVEVGFLMKFRSWC